MEEGSDFAIPEKQGGFPSGRIVQARSSENNSSSNAGWNKFETLQMKEALSKLLHCAYCDFIHKESKSMVSHMSTHTGKKPYKCKFCEFSSNWKEVVSRHAKGKHNGSNLDVEQQFKYSVNKFICRVSDDRGQLNLEEVTFPEDICGKVDSSSVEDEEPVLSIASGPNSCNGDSEVESVINPSGGSNTSSSKLGLSGFRGEFKCELCPFRAEKAFHIDFHLKRHQQLEGADFKCPHCPYWVNANKSLKRHIFLHEVENGIVNPPEEIDFIQEEEVEAESVKSFNSDNQVAQFQDQNHHNYSGARFNKRATSKNRCDACPFVAGTKTQLLYHKQFHRPNRAAYKCPHCSYSVSHQHLLNQHLKVHFGGDPESQVEAVQSLTSRTDTSKITESSSSNIPFILADSSDGSGIKVKIYHCRYCSTTNKKKMFIMAHEQLHSQGHNHVYRCSMCIFSTRIKNKYASHVDTHNDELGEPPSKKLRETLISGPPKGTFGSSGNNRRMFSYVCPDCPAAFKSPGDLKIHSVFHSENDYPHPCPYCTYKAKNKPQLCKHMYVHTQGYVNKRANSYPHGKNVAGQKPKTTNQAIEAFRTASARPTLPPPPPLYVPQQSKNQPVSIPDYDMIELDLDFSKIDASCYHSSLGRKIEKYIEQLCLIERYETKSFLDKLKIKSKHRFIFKCPACPAAFIKDNTLKFHSSLHEYQGLINCDRCTYSVDFDDNLQNHQLLHSNSNLASASVAHTYNHRCPQCPAAFSKPSRLEKHLSLHGSDAKWKCDHCDYAVPFAATLVKHRHVHDNENITIEVNSEDHHGKSSPVSTPTNSTPAHSPKPALTQVSKDGEKLYHCDRCPYSHTRKDAVQSHSKRHKSEVGSGKMCPYCDYVCLQPSYLLEHIRLHEVMGKSKINFSDLNKDLELEEQEICGGADDEEDDMDDGYDPSSVNCDIELGTNDNNVKKEVNNFDDFDLNIDWRDSFTDTHINILATPAEVLGSKKSWNPFLDNPYALSSQVSPLKSSQPRKRIRKPKAAIDPNSTETFGDLAPTRIRRQYTCEQCEFRTVNPREFLYHRRDDHQAKVKIVECPYCVYACQYFQKLQRHILLVHKLETSTTPPKETMSASDIPKPVKTESGNKSADSPPPESPSIEMRGSPAGSVDQNDESNQGELKIDMNAEADDNYDSSMNGGAQGDVECGASEGDEGEEDNFDLSFDWRDSSVDTSVNMLATPDEVVASSQKWNPIQNENAKSQLPKPIDPPKKKRVRKSKAAVDQDSTHARRQYACDQCNYRTVNPREFLYHRRDVHQARVKIVECPNCVFACQSLQKLREHMLLVHKIETRGSPPKESQDSKLPCNSDSGPDIVEQESQPSSQLQSPSDLGSGENILQEDEQVDGFMDSSMNEVECEVEYGASSDIEDGKESLPPVEDMVEDDLDE